MVRRQAAVVVASPPGTIGGMARDFGRRTRETEPADGASVLPRTLSTDFWDLGPSAQVASCAVSLGAAGIEVWLVAEKGQVAVLNKGLLHDQVTHRFRPPGRRSGS